MIALLFLFWTLRFTMPVHNAAHTVGPFGCRDTTAVADSCLDIRWVEAYYRPAPSPWNLNIPPKFLYHLAAKRSCTKAELGKSAAIIMPDSLAGHGYLFTVAIRDSAGNLACFSREVKH